MNARTSSMALDSGTSNEAGDLATAAVRDRVRAVVVTILKECGPLTDDEIVAKYSARAGSHPLVPMVTPQRVRTVRHGLVVDGLVHDTQAFGFSALGNRATVWGLA